MDDVKGRRQHGGDEDAGDKLPFHEDLSFPWRLWSLLEAGQHDDVIAWVTEGVAFRIHDEEALTKVVLPKFFPNMSKLKSFKRQLSAYSFSYVRSGKFQGACKSGFVHTQTCSL